MGKGAVCLQVPAVGVAARVQRREVRLRHHRNQHLLQVPAPTSHRSPRVSKPERSSMLYEPSGSLRSQVDVVDGPDVTDLPPFGPQATFHSHLCVPDDRVVYPKSAEPRKPSLQSSLIQKKASKPKKICLNGSFVPDSENGQEWDIEQQHCYVSLELPRRSIMLMHLHIVAFFSVGPSCGWASTILCHHGLPWLPAAAPQQS